MIELIKRFCNVCACWFIVSILPAFALFACLFLAAYRLIMDCWPSDETEKFFRMLALGEQGLFDLRKEDEFEIELEYDETCEYCEDENCPGCE
jgi:hypothetical protein